MLKVTFLLQKKEVIKSFLIYNCVVLKQTLRLRVMVKELLMLKLYLK